MREGGGREREEERLSHSLWLMLHLLQVFCVVTDGLSPCPSWAGNPRRVAVLSCSPTSASAAAGMGPAPEQPIFVDCLNEL